MSWAYRSITPIPRRKPLRRVSLKRRAETKRRRQVLQDVAERDGLGCWGLRVWPHECQGPLDGHEIVSRARYPGGHLDADNVRLVCRYCHDFIHDHPLEATALGLLRSWSEQHG